jgi:hypothetical protein
MLELIIQKIGIGILVTGMTVANWFGVIPSDYFVPQEVETKVVHEYLPAPEQTLGGSVSTPDVKALFTTSLASKISSSATSMTLVSATDKDGTTLASSTYGFIIDEGTSVEEFVLADCTGTTCTNMTRGISVSTATTSVSALKFEHRRGASVKITTAPSLVFVMNVLRGKQNIENKLRYNSTQTFSNATDIISRDYADALSFGAVPASSETASGFVELATTLEGASSTSSGSAARLVLPASSATSTYNSATAPLRVVVTQNNGKIDSNFISTSTLGIFSGNNTFTGTNTFTKATALSTSTNATTTIGSFPAWDIGKQIIVYSTPGTYNFTIPTGITKIKAIVVGGGGSTGAPACGSGTAFGGGGGAGTAIKMLDVSATTSIQVIVANGGGSIGCGGGTTGTTGGTSSIAGGTISATGGGGSTSGAGGGGGTASGGDINIGGGGGNFPSGTASGGAGGASMFGGGGRSSSNEAGVSGANYGGGGGGGSGISSPGGAGGNGVVIFTW